jgi:hypothetical protein
MTSDTKRPRVVLVAALVLVALLDPGLGQVREHLARAAPGWLRH